MSETDTAPDPARPRVVSADPLNVEAPLSLLDRDVTPTEAFYVRSNFPAPSLDAESWWLRIHGAVERPRVWSLAELKGLTPRSRRVTLECAGNGRNRVEPPPPGTPWGLGAAGTAVFTGVPLRALLHEAGVRPEATTCVFTGADRGEVEDGSHTRFQRSLPLAEALGPAPTPGASGEDETGPQGPLVVWAMNGEPLPRQHGHPVRLVVPRWYAVASVKWLVEIEVTERPFQGWFQTDRYMYRGAGEPTPVTTMRVRSLVTSHPDGGEVAPGPTRLRGVAWSGEAPVTRVEVQVDDGPWLEAALAGPSETGIATTWECTLTLAPGPNRLRVRAVDAAGRTQPDRSAWNELGYGNNGLHEIRLHGE